MFNLKRIKYLSIFLAFLFSFAVFSNQAVARDNVSEWYIKDLSTEIKVNLDSSLDISEVIVADCGNLEDKHGIFRTLPTEYKTEEGNFILPTTLKSITDRDGNEYKYTREKNGDTVTYKIGDKNKEVKGENVYIIKYRVENAIRTEKNSYDELYWNVLGNYWDMEIDNFRAKIIFPEGINKENTDIEYYAGNFGSTSKNGFDYIWLNDSELEFRSNEIIKKRAGLTLSATFPKDIVTPYKYGLWQRIVRAINDTILKYIIALIFIFLAFLIWFKYGRDPKVNKAVIAEYEPPENLSPIEIGSILKKGRDNKNSIAATIINLAVNGHLKIEKIEKNGLFSRKDYKFIKEDKETTDLYKAEEKLFSQIFYGNKSEVKLSQLKNSNRIRLTEIFKDTSSDLKKRGIIDKYGMIIGIFMIIISFILFTVLSSVNIIVAFSAFSFFIFGLLMRRLTKKGSEISHKIKGFKLYMKTVEKHRARFYEKEGIMEKFLPYAILFGITKQWLKSMKNMYSEEYFDNYQPSFLVGAVAISSLGDFDGLISDISSEINSQVSSSASGAGGMGSAGGGAGGGGGGGW